MDPSYDRSPAQFIAERNPAQQGFASIEPFNYQFVYEEYGKTPRYQPVHDAGWQIYSHALGVKPTDLETLRPCLEQLVLIIEQAVVNSANNPARANAIIVDE